MPAISQRERETLEVIRRLGGVAHPTKIGQAMGISADYAEQICDYLVWKKCLARRALRFQLTTEWDGLWVQRKPYEE